MYQLTVIFTVNEKLLVDSIVPFLPNIMPWNEDIFSFFSLGINARMTHRFNYSVIGLKK